MERAAESLTSGQPGTAKATQASAALLELSALKPIHLHARKPSLGFKLNASRTTSVTIRLLGKNHRLLASWHEQLKKGLHRLTLDLPPGARHPGRDTLQLAQTGTRASFTVTIKPCGLGRRAAPVFVLGPRLGGR